MTESLPRPAQVVGIQPGLSPRPLLPILETLQPSVRPALPSPAREPAFDAPFALTTHLIPAAYPRTYPDYPLPGRHSTNASRSEKRDLAINNARTLLEYQDQQRTTPGIGSRRVLWACLNRYARKDMRRGPRPRQRLTLFLAHANGFPKEIWEPMLHHLLHLPSAAYIDEVWSWESVQHGDAALVNEGNLGGLFNWSDNTRDILNFLLHYLPASLDSSVLPTHLPRLPRVESDRRKVNGFAERTLVAIGHSFGGCTLALAAIKFPVLFSSLLLIDPIITHCPTFHTSNSTYRLVLGALQRRDTWPSREEALKQFQQTPFFASWDPAALRVYVECGLTDDGHGGVKLKTSRDNEAIVFADRRTPYDVYEQMGQLDENVALRWIMPGVLSSRPDTFEEMQVRVWLRPVNASNIRIPNAGHLITQEAPRGLAQDLDGFFQRRYALAKANL